MVIQVAKLVSKKVINPELVYDVSVEDNHNFYANNILVHNCASKSSQQGSNLLKLKSDYQVAATGTPITNSPMSAYIPLNWTDNDRSTLTNYKSQYCEFGGYNNSQIIGYHNLEVLKEEIDGCSIRRTFDQVRGNMPAKTIEYEIVEMSDEQQKFYDAIKNGVKEEADKIQLNSNNLLALATRLRQATAAPSVLTSQKIDSAKIERAVELAEELLAANEKVVIFCNFIESANKLTEALTKYKPILCTGAQTDDYMKDGVDKFRNSGDFNLLIATISKMGVGFSFPECHYGIFLDQPFTAAQFAQACDRIYRITSDQPVYVKVLVCKDTFDERVREIIENKQELSDFIIDGVENTKFSDKLKDIILNL